MSVNAINAADAQQPKKSNTGTAVTAGVGLGLVGAGTGYFLGNKTPDLEQVFTQAPDTFSSEAVKEADAAAAKTLEDAVKEYKAAGDTKAVETAGKNRHKNIIAQTLENTELDNAVNTAKSNLANATVEIDGTNYKLADIQKDIVTKAKEHKAAKDAVKNAGEAATDAQKQAVTTAKNELDTLIARRKSFIEGAKDKVDAVRTAVKNKYNAQLAQFNTKAAAEGTEKGLQTALDTAKTNLTNARNTKKTEILGRDAIKNAFEKIKSAIPKEGGKKWAMYIGIGAAVVGLLAGAMLGGKKEA